MSNQHHSSPLRSCFGGSPTTTGGSATVNNRSSAAAKPPISCNPNLATVNNSSSAAAKPPISCNPNLATSLYHTDLGLFALTWSRSFFGRSLHLHLHLLLDDDNNVSFSSLSTPSFSLHIKPFIFWCKQGSKKLNINTSTIKNAYVYWDLSRAKFGSGPEPLSGFYIAIVIDGEMVLLVGDSPKEACAKTKATKAERGQVMAVRREHVYGTKSYTTKANFGGIERDISIDCRVGDDPRLYFSVDNKRVLKIKHLKWKFRGNERIEVGGVNVQISWDVYNWLFEDDEEGYALFTFRFEKKELENEEDYYLNHLKLNDNKNGMVLWPQQSFGFDYETKKMKKGLLIRSARSSSSSSLSSASSTSSSVMEWESMEENDLKGPSGFSLMVYAWKS